MVIGIAFSVYSVRDLKLAREFYEGILGLKISTAVGPIGESLVEYGVGPGILSITNRLPVLKPSGGGGVAVLEVSGIAKYTTMLRKRGALFVVPLTEGPACDFAMIQDPDGNYIGLHQSKK